MGRAHEVRAASMAKTALMKSKKYSKWGKEILEAAKSGVPDPEMNQVLKKTIERAKKDQCPADVIKRAIEKAKGINSGAMKETTYEGMGNGNVAVIVECLTDNVNRTVSFVREAFNKCHKSLGVTNSVSYNYDYEAVIGFKCEDSDPTFEAILNEGIEIIDFESEDGEVVITANPSDASKVKDVLESHISNIDYTLDEIGWYAKEMVTLEGEDKEVFERLLSLLEDIEDVTNIYHNVNL